MGRKKIGAEHRVPGRLSTSLSELIKLEAKELNILPPELVWNLFCERYGLASEVRKPQNWARTNGAHDPDNVIEMCRRHGRDDLAELIMTQDETGQDGQDAALFELFASANDDAAPAPAPTRAARRKVSA
ncbi:hypothetical protein [Nocardia sp. IFM 10818]